MVAFAVVVFGLVAIGTMPATTLADHANETDDRIQIVDAFNDTNYEGAFGDDGNATVAVRATTTEPVTDVQFAYDNGTAPEGPLNFSNGGVVEARYDDGEPSNRTTASPRRRASTASSSSNCPNRGTGTGSSSSTSRPTERRTTTPTRETDRSSPLTSTTSHW